MNRTLEERIKFDHGLPIGVRNLIVIEHKGKTRRAVVTIGKRGRVLLLAKPNASDMYSQWTRVNGDMCRDGEGAVIVWGARDPELMRMFDGEPVATISI